MQKIDKQREHQRSTGFFEDLNANMARLKSPPPFSPKADTPGAEFARPESATDMAKGYYEGVIDGIATLRSGAKSDTTKGIERFQSEHGLEVNGTADAGPLRALMGGEQQSLWSHISGKALKKAEKP